MSKQSKDIYEIPVNVDDTPSNGLTGIPRSIHCPATPIQCKVENNDELDTIAIERFLDTLAAVALSIAAREAGDA